MVGAWRFTTDRSFRSSKPHSRVQALARGVTADGVRVNAVAPGPTDTGMLDRFTGSTIMVAIAATAVGVTVSVSITRTLAQAPAAAVTVPALKTPWGEPDLQGIWTDEFDTPLQRPAKYAEQEFFTEAQRAELDKQRTEMLNRRAAGS